MPNNASQPERLQSPPPAYCTLTYHVSIPQQNERDLSAYMRVRLLAALVGQIPPGAVLDMLITSLFASGGPVDDLNGGNLSVAAVSQLFKVLLGLVAGHGGEAWTAVSRRNVWFVCSLLLRQ